MKRYGIALLRRTVIFTPTLKSRFRLTGFDINSSVSVANPRAGKLHYTPLYRYILMIDLFALSQLSFLLVSFKEC